MLFLRFLLLTFILSGYAHLSKAQPSVLFRHSGAAGFSYPNEELDTFLSLPRYKAVVVGETHSINVEPQFKLRLIEHLSNEYAIHDVFMEIGHSAAWLFNQYLETGDISFISNPRVAYSGSGGSYRTFWKDLYAYNQTLSPARRLKIHGTDFERTEVFQVLLALKPANALIPASLQPVFEKMEAYAADTMNNHFSKIFVQHFDEVKEVFKANLADVLICYGLNNPYVAYIINNDGPHTTAVPERNKWMLKNMRWVVRDEKVQKFVCFFGAAHTDKRYSGSMTDRIETIDQFKGKVLTVNTLYFNVYSRAAKTIIPCVGAVRKKAIPEISAQYLPKDARAVLYKSSDVKERSLQESSDYVLLVRDIED